MVNNTLPFDRMLLLQNIYPSVKLILLALIKLEFKEASNNSISADDVDTFHYIIDHLEVASI